jgi:hypothetical protein
MLAEVSHQTKWNLCRRSRRGGVARQLQRAVPVFFDLVFVLVVTQLSSLLFDHLALADAAETLSLLVA